MLKAVPWQTKLRKKIVKTTRFQLISILIYRLNKEIYKN